VSTSPEERAPELTRGLSPAQVEAVLGLGESVAVPSGAVVFPLGAEADRLFIVERGRIALTLPFTLRGTEQDLFIEEKGPGETVGWSALVPPHRFTLSGRAAVDTRVLVIARAPLLALLEREPAIAFGVMRNLAGMIGTRLVKVQAMWIREVQRTVDARFGSR